MYLAPCLALLVNSCARPTRQRILVYSEAELKSSMAKITYIIPQKKPIPTVFFCTEDYDGSIDCFSEVQNGVTYNNDDVELTHRYSIKASELRRILVALETLEMKSDPTVNEKCISFTVLREQGEKREGFEFLVDRKLANEFFQVVLNSLDANTELRNAVEFQYKLVVRSGDRKNIAQ
jgi:hypothetical protein